MLLLFFGGLLIGSGVQILLSRNPFYPKPIAAVSVLVGMALVIVGNASPSVWF